MTICMKKDQENLVNSYFRNCKLCTLNGFQNKSFSIKSIRNLHITVFQESVLEIASLCNEWQIETADLNMQRSVFCVACWTSVPIITFGGKKELLFEILCCILYLEYIHKGAKNKKVHFHSCNSLCYISTRLKTTTKLVTFEERR